MALIPKGMGFEPVFTLSAHLDGFSYFIEHNSKLEVTACYSTPHGEPFSTHKLESLWSLPYTVYFEVMQVRKPEFFKKYLEAAIGETRDCLLNMEGVLECLSSVTR
jgi:hypothetical protein